MKMKNESTSNKTIALNNRNIQKKRLYGMTIEQYKEGLEIHSKCFNQIKNEYLKNSHAFGFNCKS